MSNLQPTGPLTSTANYQKYLQTYVDSPIRHGNSVEVLTNGHEIFPAIIEAIREAKQSIAFLTYVYWKGDVAKQFGEALAERAKSGVSVCILMDAFGSSKIDSSLVKHMKDSGVIVRRFRPFRSHALRRYNNRTHRKVLVIDSELGFIGGVGIAQEWTGNAQNKRHWRDTHFSVRGPIVKDLIKSFNDNWQSAGGDRMISSVSKESAGKLTVQVTSSKPARGKTNADKLFHSVIQSSQRNLNITTAYFAPSRRFRKALIAASKAGVSVVILTNGPNTNHKVVRKAGQRYYQELLEAGVQIYEYQRTLLHAKIMTIDATWATVGSVNFDDRSFVLNDEIAMSLGDKHLVKELDEQFKQDLIDSRQIELSDWRNRSFLDRITEVLSSTIRSQL